MWLLTHIAGVQVNVLEQLADLLETMDVDRIEGEDTHAMRAEAQRKLAEIDEVCYLPHSSIFNPTSKSNF